MKQKGSIIAGAGTLYISDVGEPLPDFDIDGTWPTDSTGYMDIGFSEGITLEYEPEWKETMADTFMAPVAMHLIKESAKITANLHQKDFDTLHAIISASTLTNVAPDTVPGMEVLSIGNGTIVEKQLVFVGKSPEGFSRAWVMYRGVSTGAFTHEGTNEPATIEVEFTALEDPTKPMGARLVSWFSVNELDV